MTLLIIMPDRDSRELRSGLHTLAPEFEIRVWPDYGDPELIQGVVTWNHPRGSLLLFPKLALIHSYGAGVDHILSDVDLPDEAAICRVVDPGLAEQMGAYIHCCLLDQRFWMSRYREQQSKRLWIPHQQARGRIVGLLGLGKLGAAVADHLRRCGYRVMGWSRTSKSLQGVDCRTGPLGLDQLLSESDFVVCLLPLTPETHHLLNQTLFERMKPSAHLINVGRGGHLAENDLIVALQAGTIAGATLDVVSEEPLPPNHPLWEAPNLNLTPHISSISDPTVVAEQVIENMRRVNRGAPPLNAVDRDRHY